MQRVERLLATAEELRRHAPRPVSAARLAERLAVSRRTVERDLAALRESGLPLLHRRRVCTLTYVDASGRRTRREVEPVGLLHTPSGWYLVAWCLLRDDRRLFRLDRVHAAAAGGRGYAERDVDEVLGEMPQEVSRL